MNNDSNSNETLSSIKQSAFMLPSAINQQQHSSFITTSSSPTYNNELYNLKMHQIPITPSNTKRVFTNKDAINDKLVNIGFESIKINGAIQFKQLRNEYINNNISHHHQQQQQQQQFPTSVSVVTPFMPPITKDSEIINKKIKLNKKSETIDIGNSNLPYLTDDTPQTTVEAVNEQQICLIKQSPSNNNNKSSIYSNNEDTVLLNNNVDNSGNGGEVVNASTRINGRSDSNSSGKKEKTSSVGYRLGKRKLLFEKRRRISDYALIFAMTGVLLMIIENEFSMANIYDKVKKKKKKMNIIYAPV